MIQHKKDSSDEVNSENSCFIPIKNVDSFLSQDLSCLGIGYQPLSKGDVFEKVVAKLAVDFLNQAYFILCVLDGNCKILYDDSLYLLEKDMVFIAEPDYKLRFEPIESKCECCYVYLNGKITQKYLSYILDSLGNLFPSAGNISISHIINQMINSLYLGIAVDDENVALFTFQILCELYRLTKDNTQLQYPQVVRSALNIIREDYAYIYGIDELAAELSVSKSHLIRIFTKYLGISPGKYLTNTRLEHAKLFLTSGDYSIEVVANMSGYSDSNYFCKVFKKNTGMTPKQYANLKQQSKQHIKKRFDKSEGFLY